VTNREGGFSFLSTCQIGYKDTSAAAAEADELRLLDDGALEGRRLSSEPFLFRLVERLSSLESSPVLSSFPLPMLEDESFFM